MANPFRKLLGLEDPMEPFQNRQFSMGTDRLRLDDLLQKGPVRPVRHSFANQLLPMLGQPSPGPDPNRSSVDPEALGLGPGSQSEFYDPEGAIAESLQIEQDNKGKTRDFWRSLAAMGPAIAQILTADTSGQIGQALSQVSAQRQQTEAQLRNIQAQKEESAAGRDFAKEESKKSREQGITLAGIQESGASKRQEKAIEGQKELTNLQHELGVKMEDKRFEQLQTIEDKRAADRRSLQELAGSQRLSEIEASGKLSANAAADEAARRLMMSMAEENTARGIPMGADTWNMLLKVSSAAHPAAIGALDEARGELIDNMHGWMKKYSQAEGHLTPAEDMTMKLQMANGMANLRNSAANVIGTLGAVGLPEGADQVLLQQLNKDMMGLLVSNALDASEFGASAAIIATMREVAPEEVDLALSLAQDVSSANMLAQAQNKTSIGALVETVKNTSADQLADQLVALRNAHAANSKIVDEQARMDFANKVTATVVSAALGSGGLDYAEQNNLLRASLRAGVNVGPDPGAGVREELGNTEDAVRMFSAPTSQPVFQQPQGYGLGGELDVFGGYPRSTVDLFGRSDG